MAHFFRPGWPDLKKTQSVRILRPLTREPARHFTLFPAEMTTPPGYPTGTPEKWLVRIYKQLFAS